MDLVKNKSAHFVWNQKIL